MDVFATCTCKQKFLTYGRNLFQLFVVFIVSIFSFHLNAQDFLDKKCFLASNASDNIESQFSLGYKALFFQKPKLNNKELTAIRNYLEGSHSPLLLVFDHVDLKQWDVLEEFIYQPSTKDDVFGPFLDQNRKLFLFSSNGTFLDRAGYMTTLDNKLIKGTNNLTVFNDDSNWPIAELKSEINDLFTTHGRLPNLLLTDRPAQVKPIIDSINSALIYNAIVLEDGVKLNNVLWDTTGLRSNGKIHTRVRRVRPKKRGYIFSPDVINFNQNNASSIKIFRAHKRKFADKLALHLRFENNLNNEIIPSANHRFSSISFEEDDTRGWVGKFSGREEYIDFGNILGDEFNAITITAWVYPTSLSYNRSIVGVGESFSAKIYDGNLVFTTPDIMDHINHSQGVPANKWSHISYVYDADDSVHFYINAQLVNSLPASSLKNTAQSLIIGTNLWDEYFVGKMDDIQIWKRALSDEEIKSAFQLNLNESLVASNRKESSWLMLGISAIVLAFLILVLRFKGKKTADKSENAALDFNETRFNLKLFNEFDLVNKQELTLTRKLSPQRKELFLLTIFYTARFGGISTKQLTNILWYDQEAKNAKNSRSTQIVRLREILAQDTGIKLHYDDLWWIDMQEGATCDLFLYQSFKNENTNQPLNNNQLSALLDIIGEGSLLPKFEYEWLDKFKGEIANEILEMIIPCFHQQACLLQPTLMKRLTKTVITIDPLNEDAFNYQLNAYIKAGKHSLAKHTFEAYQKTYYNFYKETFAKNFSEYVAEVQ